MVILCLNITARWYFPSLPLRHLVHTIREGPHILHLYVRTYKLFYIILKPSPPHPSASTAGASPLQTQKSRKSPKTMLSTTRSSPPLTPWRTRPRRQPRRRTTWGVLEAVGRAVEEDVEEAGGRTEGSLSRPRGGSRMEVRLITGALDSQIRQEDMVIS